MKHNFKVGDTVVGTCPFGKPYGVTHEGVGNEYVVLSTVPKTAYPVLDIKIEVVKHTKAAYVGYSFYVRSNHFKLKREILFRESL